MEDVANRTEIDPNVLVARLKEVEADADGDIARVIELLLVENHALRSQCSRGLNRGQTIQATTYPRFLEILTDKEQDAVPSASET
ncbi:MAG: hypothetical protein JJ911_19355 [Rhizobiaceae bacterium]|nr:hypothetical protein [Rhizobiaceae bacterium]